MGTCVYCGRSAGLFRDRHKECEACHRTGWDQMLSLVAESVTGKIPFADLEPELRTIASQSFVPANRFQEARVGGWERAVEHFLEDGHLDKREEECLSRFLAHFSMSQEEVDVHGAYSRLVKGAVLRDLLNGELPERIRADGRMPFNFQKTEKLVWLFADTEYYEDRTRRQYVGGHQGVSLRVAKGVYYRVGAFKGHPVETSERILVSSGMLGVTSRHVYFSGNRKALRIRHDKIVSIEPHSDGVTVHRDAQSAKPQTFVTGDGWFTYNLLMNVSQI